LRQTSIGETIINLLKSKMEYYKSLTILALLFVMMSIVASNNGNVSNKNIREKRNVRGQVGTTKNYEDFVQHIYGGRNPQTVKIKAQVIKKREKAIKRQEQLKDSIPFITEKIEIKAVSELIEERERLKGVEKQIIMKTLIICIVFFSMLLLFCVHLFFAII